jgi:hypothetical protein
VHRELIALRTIIIIIINIMRVCSVTPIIQIITIAIPLPTVSAIALIIAMIIVMS